MTRIKSKLLVMILGCFSLFGFAQSGKEITPKTYVASKTETPIVIDGEDTDVAWNKAEWTALFEDIENNVKPKYGTKVKMLWDETNFYILAKLDEPHVWANLKQRDTIIFYNNDFEVFIDPDSDTFNYYELEINALNTAWDLFLSKPYRENDNVVLNDWNIPGLKSAVKIKGTLNNPNDTDEGWVLEMAIPWASYKTSYFDKNVPADKFWRVNFSRVNWQHTITDKGYERKKGADGKFLPEYNWVWSPMGVINMHEPEKWGYVYFSSKEGKDSFTIPQEEKVKWELYTLYRAQKEYYQKNNKWATSLENLTKEPISIDTKVLKPKLENHASGFNISVKSPFSNKTFIIRQDGKIINN
ncbi:carbohydrate-binding family 9-like protein [Flavobacterium circumlabens]|uniref:Carbohydrate binding protein with CBM9 domain n=1 Tax=Flavobacterium circumlabens TaxID=2133765 RepID=A0A4Y7UCZ1_9FLAO|nr:carbohydrate-binding family 9-like protein [Flavobacterium circumlabens]TCN58654.1 carbohydrate binding protein with CBM9 domain [Flavobacterium circumlabens]TEB44081.1 carbohydrate-binding family 9-like protein [Flavobacterium circumlabens]